MVFGSGSIGANMLGTGIVFALHDAFSASSDRIVSKFRTLEGVSEAAAKRIEGSIPRMKAGLAGLAIGGAMLASLAFPVDAAMGFEAQLSSIRAVSDANLEQMQQIRALSLQMGKETKYSALESAQGVKELIKAGVSLTDVMNGGLAGALNLAAAGEISVADAAEIASTALNAFKFEALTVTRAADILAGAANASATDVAGLKMGLSQASAVAAGFKMTMLDTATALAVFAQNGLKGSDGGTSLKNMLLNLIPQTKMQKELSRELGLIAEDGSNAFFDQAGQLKNLADISQVLQDKFSGLTDEQRLSYMQTLFGTDAIRAANILYKEGAKGVNDMAAAMQKFTAKSVAEERMKNLSGAVEQLKGSWETLQIVIGSNLLAPLAKFANGLQFVVDKLTDLAMSPAGEFIVYLVGAMGLLISALSLFAVVSAGAAFVAGETALAFASMGMTAVAAAFAEGGLTAGTIALTSAVWALLAPLLPIIIGVGAFVAVVYMAYKGLGDFNAMADGTGEKLTGIAGFFQKVGGVIQGMMEIWSSATSEGFQLSEKTYAALERLGIADFVTSIGTWIVRFKTVFVEVYNAVVPTIVSLWGYFKDVFTWFSDTAGPILESVGINMSKLGGKMETFAKVGRFIGNVLSVAFTVVFGAIAVAFQVAAAAVVGIIWVLTKLWSVLKAGVGIVTAVVNFFVTGFAFILEVGYEVFGFLKSLFEGTTWADAGRLLVNGLMEGIASAWEGLKNLFLGLISSLPFGDKILASFGVESGDVGGTFAFANSTDSTEPTGIGTSIAQSKAEPGSVNNTTTTHKEVVEVVKTVNLTIDGKKMRAQMNKYDREEESGL